MAAAGPKILIVDDQRAVREELSFALQYEGFSVLEAADGEAGIAAAKDPQVAAVLLDVKMPGLDGLEVLVQLKELRPELAVVMISGHGDVETAVVAVKKGAHDFLQKPFDTARVLVSVNNALRSQQLTVENRNLKRELQKDLELLGQSDAMQTVRSLLTRVAPTDAQVLITGDNGTGKELAARQIHLQSRRSNGPFVAVNCAAIPAELVESELFGHEKGAFTGATEARVGHFQQASGGTLLLDEVGDMPLAMQSKLLRALQERVIQRVGSSDEIEVDVRVLAATNQDLAAMVSDKEFREDLFYRLHVVVVQLPPLRDRPTDIDELAPHFLTQSIQRNGIARRKLGSGSLDWLRQQSWPGNVRQLRNIIEGAAILAETNEIGPEDLKAASVPAPGNAPDGGVAWFDFETLAEFRNATEKEFIRRKLLENSGNIKRTAERIQLQRSNLYKKLDKYGLK